MPDLALDPHLLAAKPEVVIAVMGAKFDALKDAVLGRMDAADARHREFESSVREMVQHESANRKLADQALQHEIAEVDSRKVIEAPQFDMIEKRYAAGIAIVNRNTDRLDQVEREIEKRRVVEKVVAVIGTATVGAVGWLLSQAVAAGYLHH